MPGLLSIGSGEVSFAFVRSKVSAAKVPKIAELMTEFPRSEARKVNRLALPKERV